MILSDSVRFNTAGIGFLLGLASATAPEPTACPGLNGSNAIRKYLRALRRIAQFPNIPFGVSPLRNGSMNA